MSESHTAYYESPIGVFKITSSADGLQALEFTELESVTHSEIHPSLTPCFTQLDEYFAGKRKSFSLQLNAQGTDFQQRVWQQLVKIPYGRTTTYLDIASALGNKKALRAVGAANGRNPISIIVPCHRVIGSDGSLIGFGGGIWRKEYLLKHEGVILA